MTDKELADQLDAEDRLLKRGYRKISCIYCNGRGGGQTKHDPYSRCFECEGKGYRWSAPITK